MAPAFKSPRLAYVMSRSSRQPSSRPRLPRFSLAPSMNKRNNNRAGGAPIDFTIIRPFGVYLARAEQRWSPREQRPETTLRRGVPPSSKNAQPLISERSVLIFHTVRLSINDRSQSGCHAGVGCYSLELLSPARPSGDEKQPIKICCDRCADKARLRVTYKA